VISFVLGSAPTELKIPKFDRLICIAASIKDIDRIPDLTIIETHVLGQSTRREKIRGSKTKKLQVVNAGVWNRYKRFKELLDFKEYEDITPYGRRLTTEKILKKHLEVTCGVFAICQELNQGNKVIVNRVSFQRRQDAEAYKILKNKIKWLK